MARTVRFVTGFELNTLTANQEFETVSNAGGALSIVTSPVRTGTYALRCLANNSSGYIEGSFTGAMAAGRYGLMKLAVRLVTAPSGTATVATLRSTAGGQGAAGISLCISTGRVLLLVDGDGVTQATGPTMTLGQWYVVEFAGIYDTNDLEWRVDGSAQTNGVAGFECNAWRVGIGAGDNAFTSLTSGEWIVDDVVLADGTETADTVPTADWIGTGKVILLQPDGAGEAANSTGTYADIDDAPGSISTSDIVTQTTNGTGWYTMGATPAVVASGDTIDFVVLGGLISSGGNTATHRFSTRTQSGGTIGAGTAVAFVSTTYQPHDDGVPRQYGYASATEPQGGGAWTKTLLDALRCGYERTAGTQTARCAAMWVYVHGTFTGSAGESHSGSAQASSGASAQEVATKNVSAAPQARSGASAQDVASKSVSSGTAGVIGAGAQSVGVRSVSGAASAATGASAQTVGSSIEVHSGSAQGRAGVSAQSVASTTRSGASTGTTGAGAISAGSTAELHTGGAQAGVGASAQSVGTHAASTGGTGALGVGAQSTGIKNIAIASLAVMGAAAQSVGTSAAAAAGSIQGGIGASAQSVGVGPQTARPIEDVSVGGWTNELGATTNLYASIDEPVANDADYVQSSMRPVNDPVVIRLSGLVVPNSGGRYIAYRYGKNSDGGAREDLTVEILEGLTVIQTWTHTNVPAGWTDVVQTISNAINDYDPLDVRFTANEVLV